MDARELLSAPLDGLLAEARRIRDLRQTRLVTYSPKVFIPLTKLCRDVCHYCTFARPPRRGERCYMTPDEVLAIAMEGREAGCHEALFTLGDKPELRYRAAREELERLGFPTTAAYLAHCAGLVLRETGLLPHANPGILDDGELLALRAVSASQGIMLETASARLSQRGEAHFGSPDKLPAARLATLDPFLSPAHDDTARAIVARIQLLPMDDGGRVRLPDAMIAHAALKDRVAFVGLSQKFQIWDADAFAAAEADSIARMKAQREREIAKLGGEGA